MRSRFQRSRTKTLDEGQGDHRRRHIQINGLLHCPAPLARVADPGSDLLQGRAVGQGPLDELQQPGPYHASVLPDIGNVSQVKLELLPVLQDGEALGIGLHQTVFDAVVDHLDEVARTAGAHAPPALVRPWRQSLENGPQPLDNLLGSAHHHAVAFGPAPDAAAGAHVQIVQAVPGHGLATPEGLLVVGIAAIDDHVIRAHEGQQRGDGLVHGLAGRNHEPDGSGCWQCLDQSLQGFGTLAPLFHEPGHRFGATVVADDIVTARPQPLGHVAAHASQANHTDVHVISPRFTGPIPRAGWVNRARKIRFDVVDSSENAWRRGR